MKIKIEDFLKLPIEVQNCAPDYLSYKLSNAYYFQGIKEYEVPDNFYEVIRQKVKEEELRQANYSKIEEYRLNGMYYDKNKEVDIAIYQYAKAIELGETVNNMFHAYAYAYERIFVLLHKIKDYQAEYQYLEKYLAHEELNLKCHEKTRAKYQERFDKLKNKLQQQ